tara:strand:- start:1181 stop:1945 length:765 start_codon:yes stop_codon:yes gene_type:complete
MIQAIRGEDFLAVINTEANRINVSLESTHIFHLVKFINDFDGEVFYCYPKGDIENRQTGMVFYWSATPNLFAWEVDLKAPGYFKYEVYEVSWIDITAPPGKPESWNPLQAGYAPTTETDTLTVDDHQGVVEGLVAIGLLYLKPATLTESAKATETELVTYRQYVKRIQKLTIADAGSGYLSAPLITIAKPSEVGGGRATATCNINGSGEIYDLVITYAGSGYTENPVVTVASGAGEQAYITATTEEENYIYSEK